ncbi:annexin D5 [Trifolium repens]|nr:annexin D5 [Trifolium repens]
MNFLNVLFVPIQCTLQSILHQLLLAYINTPRYEGPEFDQLVVEEDAKQIYKAGEKRIGTDEKTFIRIFSERSTTHLAAVNTAYKTSFGNTLEKAIKKETWGSFLSGLLTILRCATNSSMYFAKVLIISWCLGDVTKQGPLY